MGEVRFVNDCMIHLKTVVICLTTRARKVKLNGPALLSNKNLELNCEHNSKTTCNLCYADDITLEALIMKGKNHSEKVELKLSATNHKLRIESEVTEVVESFCLLGSSAVKL